MPTVQIPVPLIGKDFTSATVTGINVAGTGIMTLSSDVVPILAGSSATSVGKSVTISDEVGVVEINALNTKLMNEVILTDAWSLALAIYLVNNGNDIDPLMTLASAYDYMFVTLVKGTAAPVTQWFIGHRGNISEPVDGRGEQLCDFSLGPCDPGVLPFITSAFGGSNPFG